jgi:hypothetical protein
VDELDLLIAQRPPAPTLDEQATAAARRALVAHVDARSPSVLPAPRTVTRHVLLAAAAAVLLVVLAAGALALLPERGIAPSSDPDGYAVPAGTPAQATEYLFSSSPSPDLPLAPGEPPTGAATVAEPFVPPTDISGLSDGRAPFRLAASPDEVEVGSSWTYDAAPLHAGGVDLEGTCEATLDDVADDGRASVAVSCSWPDPQGDGVVATSEETWVVAADGGLVSWRQELTPTGSTEPGVTTLERA